MGTRSPHTSTRLPQTKRIPPLENGDRLTREEFERRYEAMPHVKKAELNLAAVLAVLQQGIASPEHAAFVARLQATKST